MTEPAKPMTWEEALETAELNLCAQFSARSFRAGFQSRDAEVEQLKADLRTALDGWETDKAAIKERWGL